jgi:phage protein D
MCETTDFTAEPKIDEALKKSLAKTVSAERRLKQAQGEEKGKIDAWRKLQNAKNEVEVAKTMFRPKRYVSKTAQADFLDFGVSISSLTLTTRSS